MTEAPRDFIRQQIDADRAAGLHGGRVHTRFPPEPNGYLHIGHAKSICLNFGIAAEYGGLCNLRFDDTNPTKEETEYVEAIQADVRWLGFDWGDRLYYASDYFEKLYGLAEQLIEQGLAYVDSQTQERIRAQRGTLNEPGVDSPHRERPVAENLDLFRRMRAGEFPDGAHVLRAKIDMGSPNINLRDPAIYRIRHAAHHRTGDRWCIYPMYDFTHCLSDSLEGITHSLCTLEFENQRPLYDWFIERLGPFPSRQIEFSKLRFTHTIVSKRRLLRLVEGDHVSGWDDPRMPTLSGLRRRGYAPEAIRTMCAQIGVTKYEGTLDLTVLENAQREFFNKRAARVMGVLRPLKLVLENYPEDQVEELEAVNNPEDAAMGTRRVPFSRELYIERDDFMAEPPKKFFRLGPGREVRLRYGYFVTCTGFDQNDQGEVVAVRCTYDPATRGGDAPDGRKVKGTIHWVSAARAVDAEVRLYEPLFATPDPDEGVEDFLENLNPNSLEVLTGCKLEPGLAAARLEDRYQFERLGYFCPDRDSAPGALVFHRIVGLRDSWAKEQKKGG